MEEYFVHCIGCFDLDTTKLGLQNPLEKLKKLFNLKVTTY